MHLTFLLWSGWLSFSPAATTLVASLAFSRARRKHCGSTMPSLRTSKRRQRCMERGRGREAF